MYISFIGTSLPFPSHLQYLVIDYDVYVSMHVCTFKHIISPNLVLQLLSAIIAPQSKYLRLPPRWYYFIGLNSSLVDRRFRLEWYYKITTSFFLSYSWTSSPVSTSILFWNHRFISQFLYFPCHFRSMISLYFWLDRLGHRINYNSIHTFLTWTDPPSPQKGLTQKARWYLGNLKKRHPLIHRACCPEPYLPLSYSWSHLPDTCFSAPLSSTPSLVSNMHVWSWNLSLSCWSLVLRRGPLLDILAILPFYSPLIHNQ